MKATTLRAHTAQPHINIKLTIALVAIILPLCTWIVCVCLFMQCTVCSKEESKKWNQYWKLIEMLLYKIGCCGCCCHFYYCWTQILLTPLLLTVNVFCCLPGYTVPLWCTVQNTYKCFIKRLLASQHCATQSINSLSLSLFLSTSLCSFYFVVIFIFNFKFLCEKSIDLSTKYALMFHFKFEHDEHFCLCWLIIYFFYSDWVHQFDSF